MRSYEAARSLFAFLSFLSWVVIILGGFAALFGGAAASEMMRYGEQFIGLIAGAIPGLILALMGFFGLAFAQIGRAGVDTAEYSQQSLQISREQLEVSRQALRHGEEVKNGFASLKAQAAPPVTASYAGINGQKRNDVPAEDLPVSAATYAKTIDYNGQRIQVLDHGYHFASTFFTTLEAAHKYVDELETAPKSLTAAS